VGLIETLNLGDYEVGLKTPDTTASWEIDGMLKALALVSQVDGSARVEPPPETSASGRTETAHILLGLPEAVSGRDGWDLILPFDSPDEVPS
jgi:hypothetical protein